MRLLEGYQRVTMALMEGGMSEDAAWYLVAVLEPLFVFEKHKGRPLTDDEWHRVADGIEAHINLLRGAVVR